MQTINDIMKKGDISRATVHNRINRLEIELIPIYQQENGHPVRIFTDKEAEAIINWTGAKPGRKKQNG